MTNMLLKRWWLGTDGKWHARGEGPYVPPKSQPTAAFTSTPAGLTVAFDASTSTDTGSTLAAYAWTFGDGATGTGKTVSHAYAGPGNYTVTLTVTDLLNASSTVSHPIAIAAGVPTAAFTSTATYLAVAFDGSASSDSGASITGWAWTFGDGTTGSGKTASHTYAAAGSYTATLKVTDSTGQTAQVSHNLALSAQPANQLPTASFTSTISGATVSVNGGASSDPDGSISSYAWTFGDGGTATGATASHTYATSGTYTVTLKVTDNVGGTATVSHSVTATVPAPAPSGTGGDSGGTGVLPTGAGIASWASLSGSEFSTRSNSAGTSNLVAYPAGTYSFSDFSYPGGGTVPSAFFFGAKLSTKGILGPGSNYTTIQMNPGTSTKAYDIPVQGTYESNQLYYIWLTGANAKVDGVKIVGTNQGHLYNGLHFEHTDSPTLSNVTVTGVPGNAGSPPGETFGVEFQGCTGTVTVTNVTVDGQNLTAAAMGSNNSAATYNINNYYAVNNKYSAGWASWEHMGVMNFHGFVVRNGARAFNAERLAGVVNFYDPLWDQPFSGHADVNPTFEPGWTGGVLNFYFSSAAAWSAFVAPRSTKAIMAVTDQLSIDSGLRRSTVIKVYVAGVLQTQSNYVVWNGAGAGT